MKVVFHPEAYDEMLESARFYEARSEGLGSDFLSAVKEVTLAIRQFPEAGRLREIRRAEAPCAWLSIHDSLPGAERSDLHRSGNASASTTWLLEKAIKPLSSLLDDRFWEAQSRDRASFYVLLPIPQPAVLIATTIQSKQPKRHSIWLKTLRLTPVCLRTRRF